jgi:hypothetical protein
MNSTIRRHFGRFAVVIVTAPVLLASTAAAAFATVPGGLVDGQGQNIGRGGGFTVTTLSGWGALDVIGGLAISAAAIALVAWLGIRSDIRARTRLTLTPSESSAQQVPERTDQERRAA